MALYNRLRLPLCIAYCLLNYLLADKAPLRVSFSRRILTVNVFALVTFAAVSSRGNPATSGPIFLTLWLSLAIATLMSAFLVFIPWQFYLKNPRRWALLPCAIIGASSMLAQNTSEVIWLAFGQYTSKFLNVFFVGGKTPIYFTDSYLHIGHRELPIIIGKGCAGFDAFYFFTSCLIIYLTMNRSVLSRANMFLITAIGLIFTLLLSIFRMVVLFVTGLWLVRHLGESGLKIFLNVVHVNTGWIMYAVGMCCFFGCLNRLVTRGWLLGSVVPPRDVTGVSNA